MPITPDPPFPKTQGDNIRSKDWNDAVSEIIRLDNAKANRAGDTFTGPLTINGSVGIGTSAPSESLHTTGRVRAGNVAIGPWPANGSYQFFGVSTLDQTQAGNYALLQGTGGGDAGRTMLNSPTAVHLRIGNTDRAIVEGNGNLLLGASTNPMRFSDAWTDFPASGTNRSEISNDVGNYKTLMIIGNRSGGGGVRRVGIWDRLDVNGTLAANGPLIVSSGAQTISLGVPYGPYAGDGIRGFPNLWLDANGGRVIIKAGFTSQGMDVAERFPVIGEVRAGEVVVYDEAVGAVRPCTQAYDTTAVGIVSEAPAFVLGLEVAEAPIALCGRVPCYVDADIAPIAPGDLLVASATPGHAQKLLDPERSAGRVIGKALESLACGRGRILAFVLAA